MATRLKKKLDYDDYAGIPSDGNRYEIIEGDLYVTPAPSPLHQRVSRRLQRKLEDHCAERGLGEVFNAPIDLVLTRQDVVQPDLLIVGDPAQVSQRAIEGAPLLVVEILSPSTRSQDRTVKAQRYAALGIPHYWIVDPEAQRLECYRLDAGAYTLGADGEGDAVVSPPDWAGLGLSLADLWR